MARRRGLIRSAWERLKKLWPGGLRSGLPSVRDDDRPDDVEDIGLESDVLSLDRQARAQVFDAMYLDPLLGPCIDLMIEYAVISPNSSTPLSWRVDGDEEDEKLVRQALIESGFAAQLPEILRDVLLYGDAFIEAFMGGVCKVTRVPKPASVVINWDKERGVIMSGGSSAPPGFAAYEKYSGNKRVDAWSPWEIVHIAMPPISGGYGTSVFARLASDWKRFNVLERAGAESGRAGKAICVHYVPVPVGTSPREESKILLRYKMRNMGEKVRVVDSEGNVRTVVKTSPSDIFVPLYYRTSDGFQVSGRVELLKVEPLSREDMEYWLNKVFGALRVPPQLLFWDLERTRFSRQGMSPWEEHFARRIKSIQLLLAGAAEKLVMLWFLHNGRALSMPKVEISLPPIRWRSEVENARAYQMYATAIAAMAKSGIDPAWVLRHALGLSDDEIRQAMAGGGGDNED